MRLWTASCLLPIFQYFPATIVPALAVQQVYTNLAKEIHHVKQNPVFYDFTVFDLPEIHVLEIDGLQPP